MSAKGQECRQPTSLVEDGLWMGKTARICPRTSKGDAPLFNTASFFFVTLVAAIISLPVDLPYGNPVFLSAGG